MVLIYTIILKDNNMYNKIAYFSYLLSLILLLIVMTDWIFIDLITQKSEIPLVMIGILLSALYKKTYTIPINEAIHEYWHKKGKI